MTSSALPNTFRALLLTKDEGNRVHAEVTTLPLSDLPQGEVTVRVHASDLNYKDGLAITGRQDRPHLPDGAGDRLRRHGRGMQRRPTSRRATRSS